MGKLNSLIKISVIIGILLISGSISYYFVYFLPQQAKTKEQAALQKDVQIKLKEEERRTNLQGCLNAADANYRSLQRANGKGPNFSMPLDLAKAIDKRHNDERDDCYKQYPAVR